MRKPASFLAAMLLAVIALAHLARWVLGWPVQIDGFAVPSWWSAPPVLILGALAAALWRERRR